MALLPEKNDERPQRFGWAPGDYLCRCGGAGCAGKPADQRMFWGDKRAIMCSDCAYAEPDEVSPPAFEVSPDLTRKAFIELAEELINCVKDNYIRANLEIAVRKFRNRK